MSDPASSETRPSNDSPRPTRQSAKPIRWWLSRLITATIFLGAGVLLIVALGVAQRVGWITAGTGQGTGTSDRDSEQVFTCPMHPQIRQPGPGRCPICGMALVPATSAGADLDESAITLEPAQRRLANIQTAEVTQHAVTTTIQAIGAIEIDESRQAVIASYIDGRVERLFADYTGVVVEKGDHLAEVYSPQLYAAQVEYLEARRTFQRMGGSALQSVRDVQARLVENSRQKLVELGMTDAQMSQLQESGEPRSRLTIFAPIGGTVIEKLAEEGKYISPGEPIYRIANLSTVWLMLEMYPEDASRIRFGQVVEARMTSLRAEKLQGRVAFIDPTVDRSNRTVGVRVEFRNDDKRLRPGDYAEATIEIPIGPQGQVYDAGLAGKWISPMHPQVIRDEPGDCPICGMKLVPTSRYGYADQPVPQPESVVVPRSALLTAGEHGVVYVETEPGRFELRNVTVGPVLRDEAIILDGVKPGERVATSGNFLIDSQMQLAGKPSLIDPTRFKAGDKQDFRNTPLRFDAIDIVRIEGPAGEQLEQLYRAYFDVQRNLAADKLPTRESAEALLRLSGGLSDEPSLGTESRRLLDQVEEHSSHLHHLSLDDARGQFKRISHAIVTLATKARGDQADRPFRHFFCPMVPQGEGDWLQESDRLVNPYFGSQMLRCGELVRTIPPDDSAREPATRDGRDGREQTDAENGGR